MAQIFAKRKKSASSIVITDASDFFCFFIFAFSIQIQNSLHFKAFKSSSWITPYLAPGRLMNDIVQFCGDVVHFLPCTRSLYERDYPILRRCCPLLLASGLFRAQRGMRGSKRHPPHGRPLLSRHQLPSASKSHGDAPNSPRLRERKQKNN